MKTSAAAAKKAPKACIETYGCSSNQAESEMMAGVLLRAGFSLSKSAASADVVVFNTCMVKTPTEQKIIRRVSDMLKEHPGKRIVIAGCMPAVMSAKLSRLFPSAGLVSTQNAGRIGEAARMMLSGTGQRPVFTAGMGPGKALLPRVRMNGLIGIIPISEGCAGECAYCCVRLAKGGLLCYPPDDIIEAARRAISSGCREICITSQDNASYCHGGVALPELIKMICAIPGDFMVRIGMMNPDNAANIMDGLVDVYMDPKVYRFAHLPVQSGSAMILKSMKRKYAPRDFLSLVSALRKAVPRMTIMTDVIVGFPAETQADFEMTMRLMSAAEPDIANVSKFTGRPGTPAAAMEQVPGGIIKSRSAQASALARKIELAKNAAWVGWEGEVLFTGKGKKSGQYSGRNYAYKLILASGKKALLGRKAKIRIAGAGVTHLIGRAAKAG
jgi:threonylcarbamoyladenosine tRNA methylthiotransferase CDKAL1